MENLIKDIAKWAQNEAHIESVIIVGSYARGTFHADSDLDLCIITSRKADMLQNQEYLDLFGKVVKKKTEYYGACTSVRVWYENGCEVEFGIVEPSWIEKPLDAGTRRVLGDGYRVIVDKKGYFEKV